MAYRSAQITPDPLRIDQAIEQSTSLARLQTLLRESNARLDAVRACLPGALAAHVRPGPVDEQGWSLLAANASVAAKLRQLQPRIEARLRDAGHVPATVRIKVAP